MQQPQPDLFAGKGQKKPARKAAASQRKKAKKNKKKFYRFHFALSDKEKLRCFKRLVKKALKLYYEQADLHDLPMELENQLDLFSSTDLFGNSIPKKKQKNNPAQKK